MIPSGEQTWAHAQAVRARGNAMPPEGMPAPVILDSWVRCMEAGLDAAAPHCAPVVEAADLARRCDKAAFVRRLALAQLETLGQQIAGSNFLLAFADADGVILDVHADNRFSMSDSGASILAGSHWSEALCGTNGLGTALATGQAAAVSGLEHYLLKLGAISCIAAPVRDAHGTVVGVLDAASYFSSRQRHTQALVQMSATHIENGLLIDQMRSATVLAIHPRAEYLGTLSAGLLAFDGDGRLQAANARAAVLLAGLDTSRGSAFEELFGESFDAVLARLQVGHQVRLHDVLGSSLTATVVSRPPLRRPAAERLVPPAALPRPKPAPATGFVATDPAVAEACRLVHAAARMNVPILICGETGTGKELLARHAHAASGRNGEFVAVNCGAMPAELFESELFGYAGGAFTGARRGGSPGLIAAAEGGTLLLDEVQELPLPLQAALLRFLDDRLVRPVGGTSTRAVDLQLLAATNVSLEEEAAAKRFRVDLLYRLNTVKVVLPPLRLRQDFGVAVRSVLFDLDPFASLCDDALAQLARQRWPGNFRELRAVLTRALLACQLAGTAGSIGGGDIARLLPTGGHLNGSALQQGATELVLREFERNGGSVSQTSRSLGISRTTVYRHLREGQVRPTRPN